MQLALPGLSRLMLQAILRLMDVESGGKRGRRSLKRDLSETAIVKFDKSDSQAWKWYMNPNKSDIIKIDTTGQEFMKSLSFASRSFFAPAVS